MQFFNLLATQITVYGPHFDVALNWIGELIRILITGVGSVGVGIILFSVILRLVVLPFDVYQRIAMRKQNIQMKENQARMEKLQKQYANNKEMYNQKVMEMYKENGFSMFSACLPMIFSLVIFIVAINAFNAFAQYSNIANYNTMVDAYNSKIESYCPDLKAENVRVEGDLLYVQDSEHIVYYTVPNKEGWTLDYIQEMPTYSADGNVKKYYVDEEKAMAVAEIKQFVESQEGVTQSDALKVYFATEAQTKVLETYNSKVTDDMSFLWIKNIWVTDASYKHPVLTYTEFQQEVSREKFEIDGEKYTLTDVKQYTNAYEEHVYKEITGKLTVQQKQANGYFILIALSIGTILLQQFVTMRSQKEQQKYSTVDGQGASQQKTTMIMMTVMFAIFSFMYSSAFAIYLIMSNLLSLVSTVVINKFVDKSQEKKNKVHETSISGRYASTLKTKDKKDKK